MQQAVRRPEKDVKEEDDPLADSVMSDQSFGELEEGVLEATVSIERANRLLLGKR